MMDLEKEIKRAHAIISKYKAKTMDLEKEIRRADAIAGKYKTKMYKYKARTTELEAENARLKAQLVGEVESHTTFQPNYFRINKTAFWFYHFVIVDCAEGYTVDQAFVENGIPVSFGKEFESPEKKYKIIFVKVRKKYGKAFLIVMRELEYYFESVMLKKDYIGYLNFCKGVQRIFRRG